MKDHIYTRDWFLSHLNLRDEYRAVADVIHEVFEPRHVMDIGCGLGLIIERLTELGSSCYGFDGSTHAKECAPESIRRCIRIHDLTEPSPDFLHEHDLVICTEVAEHLEAEHAGQLVQNVVSCVAPLGYIFFTAATPGQGGTDHVNEQPNSYWIERFEANGYRLAPMRTQYMRIELTRKCPGMNWFGRSAMVFK